MVGFHVGSRKFLRHRVFFPGEFAGISGSAPNMVAQYLCPQRFTALTLSCRFITETDFVNTVPLGSGLKGRDSPEGWAEF